MWDPKNFDVSGGGFMNGSNAMDSPSAAKKEQVRRVQNVVPLVVRQIRNCQEEDFKMFGMPVQIVQMVGILRNLEVQSTRANCTIEDSTGSIKGIMWLETNTNQVTALPPVKEGCYVKVFCSIKTQDGEKMLMILKMFPVDDCNIIVNHLLQMIHARLALEKQSEGVVSVIKPGGASASSFSDMGAIPTSDATTSSGLTTLQDKIYRLLLPIHDSVGLSRDKILANFPPNQKRDVNNALEFLLNEGHAYTTINDDHFKVTDQ